MDEDEIYEHLAASPMFDQWHWFRYRFERKLRGEREPFAEAIAEACVDCEERIPGYARRTLDVLAAIGGRDRDHRDYQQLLQVLAELLVMRQLVTYAWPYPVTYAFDPTPAVGARNPELTVTTPTATYGFEVKAPGLLDYIRQRSSRALQAPSRGIPIEQLVRVAGSLEEVTLPRDNPLKDFRQWCDR